MQRIIGILAVGVTLIAATPTVGGWAVITVDELPAQFVVGQPTLLAFTVLQHGETPMPGLSPKVTLKRMDAGWMGGRQSITATPGPDRGSYQATVTPEEAGEFRITIDAQWRDAKITLLPVVAVASAGDDDGAGGNPYVHGRQLFVSKGCVTCHAKRDDADVQEQHMVGIGPELTGRSFAAEWLANQLADPTRNMARATMPNLDLSEREIAALVSYVNGQGATRASR
jgi:mono/diheme cytochrome c family protein